MDEKSEQHSDWFEQVRTKGLEQLVRRREANDRLSRDLIGDESTATFLHGLNKRCVRELRRPQPNLVLAHWKRVAAIAALLLFAFILAREFQPSVDESPKHPVRREAVPAPPACQVVKTASIPTRLIRVSTKDMKESLALRLIDDAELGRELAAVGATAMAKSSDGYRISMVTPSGFVCSLTSLDQPWSPGQ